eukprot:1196325-Prorocentrum_minimum.AAC.2
MIPPPWWCRRRCLVRPPLLAEPIALEGLDVQDVAKELWRCSSTCEVSAKMMFAKTNRAKMRWRIGFDPKSSKMSRIYSL